MEAFEIVIQPDDLDVFSKEEDVFEPHFTLKCKTKQLDDTITSSANQALQVCNALAQFMMAKYSTDDLEGTRKAQIKAEHIAYDLGESEFHPDEHLNNPFDELILAKAWQKGFDHALRTRKNSPLVKLQEKWEEGIDTEDNGSQYELCALQLYRLAANHKSECDSQRAKRLALEMCRYHEGEIPTSKRQREIDCFMENQTARLALAIDI